jgi:exodeoxyribonuclease III
MLIATWNVNSIRSREERLLRWLQRHQPDVLCLQELKVPDADFPVETLRAAGYHSAAYGQKTYNGVAILSKHDLTDVRRGFGDESDDDQARCIAARVGGMQVLSVYVPNGAFVGSIKYEYKRAWLKRFQDYLRRHDLAADQTVVCGDLNIAPHTTDVARPAQWAGSVLYNEDMSLSFQSLLSHGLVDVVRRHFAEGGLYSWWDYRQLAFVRNNGLRIDHILASESCADRCLEAGVDREERKGDKPSDHAPVWARFT